MAASSKQPYLDQRRRSQLPQLSRFTPVDELGTDDNKNDVMTTTSTTTRANHDSTVKSHMRTSSSIRARGDSLQEQKAKDEEKRRSAQLDQSVIRPRGSSTTTDTTRQLRSPTKLDRSSSLRRPGSSTASALPRSTSIRAPASHNRSASVLEGSSKSPVKTSRHNASSSADTSRGQDRPTQLSKSVVQARVSSKPVDSEDGNECQQIELFQLSLLHQSSFANMKKFSESGQKELMKRYIRLRQSLRGILDEEQEQQTLKNLDALLRWQPEQSNLIDTLHTIQRVYQDVKVMTLNGSAYGDIIVDFHVWMEKAMDCVGGKVGGKFAVPLQDKWRHSHASAALEIRSMQRELAALPAALPPSSLASIIKSCEVLLDGMLKELDIMLMIEKTLLKLDRARVDQAVTSIRHSQPVDTQKWIPAWH